MGPGGGGGGGGGWGSIVAVRIYNIISICKDQTRNTSKTSIF